MAEFVASVSRAPAYSKISKISGEIDRPFWRLGNKYPNFPFGFLFCFDCVSQETKQISHFKIDKAMPNYRNETALILTITIFEEDIKEGRTKNKAKSDDHIRKTLGKEFFYSLQLSLRKQFKKHPVVKELYFEFIDDIEKSLQEIGWINSERKKQVIKTVSDQYYYNSNDSGIARETSHPSFLEYFKEDFYFDQTEKESPFGNDAGFDTLQALEQNIKANDVKNIEKFPQHLIEEWGLKYYPPEDIRNLNEYVPKLKTIGFSESYFIDQVIFATALGQVKITGKINRKLKKLASLSFMRILSCQAIQNIQESEMIRITYEDLESFDIYS